MIDRAWTPLRRELDHWADAGRVARFWWRDDDAIEPSPALDRLLGFGLPLALAVIPGLTGPNLAERLAVEPHVTVLQHGIRHRNTAPPGEPSRELGSNQTVVTDLARAQGRMRQLFAAQFRPVLVPPWNRIVPAVIGALPEIGFTGLSTAGPRPAAWAAPGLRQINAHLDPIDWRGTRQCRPTPVLVDRLTRHLAAARAGQIDADEPVGLLTHHLLDDSACWAFVAALSQFHPAIQWLGADEVFG